MLYLSLMYAVSVLHRALQLAETARAKKRNKKSTACILYVSLPPSHPNSQEFESAVISVNQWRIGLCYRFSYGLLPMACGLVLRGRYRNCCRYISATYFLMITKRLDEKVAR